MSARRRRLNRKSAEQWLSGTPSRPDALASLLAAATAPVGEHELRGEEAAVSAFLAARHSQRTVVPQRRLVARVLTFKVALFAAVAAGSVAIAASTGSLPSQNGVPVWSTTEHVPSKKPTVPELHAKTAAPVVTPTVTAKPSQAAATKNITDLCRMLAGRGKFRWDWNRETGSQRQTDFDPLIKAAGGPDKVIGYCMKLLYGKDHPSWPTNWPRPPRGGR